MSLLKELKGQIDPEVKKYDKNIGEVNTGDFFGNAIDANELKNVQQPELPEGTVVNRFGQTYEKDAQYEEAQLLKGEEMDPSKLYPQVGMINEYLQNNESLTAQERDYVNQRQAALEVGRSEDPLFESQAETPSQYLPVDQGDVLGDAVYDTGRALKEGVYRATFGFAADVLDFSSAINPIDKLTGLSMASPLADWFREMEYSGRANMYDPKKLQEFSMNNLLDSKWWSTRMPKVLPDAIAMLFGAKALATVGTKVVLKGGRKLVKKGIIKPGARYGGITYKRGGMGAGSMFTTIGGATEGAGLLTLQLSKRGLLVTNMVAGGVGMNALNGARIGGNAYNEAIDKGFDKETAGEIARGIFVDNLKWIGVDALSYGFAYGKLGRELTRKSLQKSVAATKNTVGTRVKDLIVGMGKSAAVGVPEGIEEMFQETYEDWIVKSNFAEAEGKEFMNYWDYFNSQGAAETKAVSFIIGMFMGGGVHAINSIANSNRTIENRQKLLEEVLNNPTIDDEVKKAEIMANLVAGAFAYGSEQDIRDYVQKLYDEKSIDEDTFNKYTEVIDQGQKAFENIPFIEELTPEMQQEYLYRSMNIVDLNRNKTDLDQSLAENIEKINNMKGMSQEQKQQAIDQATQENEQMKQDVDNLIAENESMQASIINELITQKGTDQRTRYRKGVKKGAKGEDVRGGRFAGEQDVLSDEERAKLTKQGQKENWDKKYRKDAIKRLEEAGIETTEDNILDAMRQLSQEPKSIRTGIRTALQGVGKMIKRGVQSIRESGVTETVTEGVKSAVQGIKNVIKGDVNLQQTIANLGTAAGTISKKVFSYVKTFSKNFKGKPIYKEDGTPTDAKFVNKVLQSLEDATGIPFTKMSEEESKSFMNVLFPDNNIDKISNMTNEEFDAYIKERIDILAQEDRLDELDAKIDTKPLDTGKTPQQEAKQKTDIENQIRLFAEKIADGKTVATKEEQQFYQNYAKEIEEELKKIQKEREKTTTKKKKTGKKKRPRTGTTRKKKLDKATVEEKQAKKRKTKKTKKTKKDKTPDPFGNKRLKVKEDKNTRSPKIDRVGEVTRLSAINDVIRKYRRLGKTIDKTAIIVVSELTEVVPAYALGQAFGGAVFIRGGDAWQETLAHEYGGHIYYRAYSHTDTVKNIVKNLIGTKLWDDMKESYYNLTMFKFTNPISGETTNLTIEDIGGIINRYMDDKRTRFSKSDQAEFRNIREAINNVLNAKDYVARINAMKRLEIQLKAADMIEDIPDNQQEALKEEAFAKSTEQRSKEVVSEMLGIEKTEVHKKLATRFWDRVKRQFGRKDMDLENLSEPNVSYKQKINTFSSQTNMLRKDVEDRFNKNVVGTVRPYLSSVFRDLSELARSKNRYIINIAEDDKELENYINNSFEKLGYNFNYSAWGKDSMNILKDFIRPLAVYHATNLDPNFKSKVQELTMMDWFEDLSSRDVSEEILNDASNEFLTEADWLIKGKEMIDDFMVRQGMDPDMFLENLEGDGKLDYEDRKGGQQPVSNTVQRIIKLFTKERYSEVRKTRRKLSDDREIERYENVSKALRNGKVLQGDLLLSGMSSKFDPYTFIDTLRNSENVQTIEFINWLENKFGGRSQADAFLTMMHKEFSDRVQEKFYGVSQVENNTDSKEFVTKELFSFYENNIIENIDALLENYYNKKHSRKFLDNSRKQKIEAIINALDKPLSTRDSISILKMLFGDFGTANNYIDWNSISMNGVTINGKTMSIEKATEKILKSSLRKRGGDYFIDSKKMKPLVKELINKSRRKNYVTLINNIEGKPTNIANKGSYMTRKVDTINEMFRRRDDETVEEYRSRTDEMIENSEYNIFTFLAAHEQELEIGLRSGMDSEVNNQASVYVRMSGLEIFLGDMATFFENYEEGVVGSYDVPITVFAEKSRRYAVKGRLFSNKKQLIEQIEKLDYLAGLTYLDGSLVFPLLKENGKFNQTFLNEQVKETIKFIQENPSMFKSKTFNKIVNPKTGKLKDGAKKFIELNIMNYAFNRVQAQRLLIGRHEDFSNATDYTKRAAGSIARHIPFDKSINMDVVMFEDIYKTEDGRFLSETEAREEFGDNFEVVTSIATDGAMYVLEEQAQQIKDSYGELNNFGEHFKFVYNGSGLQSVLPLEKTTSSETMYLKGNTFVLTDENVKDSVYLQNIKKLLESRNKYFKQDNDVRYEGMFTIAASNSSVKVAYNKSDLIHNISGLESMNNFTDIHAVQEENYSDGAKFVGMDGSNFGVQLILDTDKLSTPLSVQLFSNILINANVNQETYNQTINVLDLFARSMKAKSNERVDKLKAKNPGNAVNVNKNIMQTIGDWAGSANKSLARSASPLFPKNNIIKNSLGGNAIAQTGSRIYLDQMSENMGAGMRAYQAAEGTNLKSYTTIKTRSGIEVYGNEFIAPHGLKKLGYKKGDVIIGTRIPGKSKADHFVLVIKDFHNSNEGAKVTVPSELSKTIGSDLDGDAIFLAGRYRDPVASTKVENRLKKSHRLYNKGFDALVNLLQNPEFRKNEIEKDIDIKKDSESAIREAEQNLGIDISKEVRMNTPLGDMEIFNNNIPARGLIGTITNFARNMHYLSFYNVGIKTSVTINGNKIDNFNNDNPLNYFTVAQSQNVALDNAKYLFANNLGMNNNTVKQFIILQRLGFSTGDIATIMNSEAAKLYNKHVGLKMVTQKSSEKINIDPSLKALYDLKNKGRNVEDDLVSPIRKQEAWEKINFEYKQLLSDNVDNNIEIDFKDIKNSPDKFNLQVLKLLYYGNNLSNDIQKLGNLLGIYKYYPKDSYATEKMRNDINSLTEESSNLEKGGVDKMLTNPIIKRNLEVLQELDNQYRNTNIVDSEESHRVNEIMKLLTEEQNPMSYHPRIGRTYGRIKMLNNITFLKNLKSREDLLQIIQEARITFPENIALNEAISLMGNRNYETGNYEINTLRINRGVVHEYTSDEIIDDYKDGFEQLPDEIQKAIIQLDFIDNGWTGGTTAVIWGNKVWDVLNPQLESLRKQVSTDPLSEEYLKDISLEIIKNEFRLMPKTNQSGNLSISGKGYKYVPGKRQSKIIQLQDLNEKHYIKHWDKGNQKYVRLEYIGNSRYKAIDDVSNNFTGRSTKKQKEDLQKKYDKLKKGESRKIDDVSEYLNRWRSGSNMLRPSYRKKVSDNAGQEFFNVLDKKTWLKRKKIDISKVKKGSVTMLEIDRQYQRYLDGMDNVYQIYFDLQDQSNMDKFSSEQLVNLAMEFNNPKMYEQEVSKVMEGLISVELANRAAKEQSKITGVGPNTAGLNDISTIKSWLISNNIPAEHPAVQNLVKQMEVHHNKYTQAYTTHVKDLAKAERALDRYYSKKYGKVAKLQLLFANKWADTKYNKMIREIIGNDGDKYIELVDRQALIKSGATNVEIEFYDQFVNSMKKFGKTESGYIPHVMMGNYESLMKRGLFGMYNSNLGNTSKIDDIMVEGLGPTGREVRPFSEWRKIYEDGSFVNKGRKIMEFDKIRRKAKEYLQRGKDAEGNEIGMSMTELKGILGSNVFGSLASSKQVKMSDIGSKDLGKIGRMFVRTRVFSDGDIGVDNSTGFRGMKRMAPLIDGLIRVYKDNNNPRMAKYIEEVWKDGYLHNRKQTSFLGKAGDRIVDLIIKHTLYVALGFGVIPAIGNILIGKYNQLRSKGGKEFLLGEQRFWDPNNFKRNQLIIEQVMKQEYTVYDDVYSVNQRSWIDKLVFWPMNASEKWIQGAAFLGTFTEEELGQFKFDEDGVLVSSPLSEQEIVKRYDRIKREQGRGFSPVDQRLLGMYSWGRALLQFTRWLPTLINERFGKETINRFGEVEVGSYTAAAEFGRDLILGRKTWSDYNNLPEYRKEAIRKWYRGAQLVMVIGLLSMLAGGGGDDRNKNTLDRLYDDTMILTDYDRLKWVATPAVSFTIANYIDGVQNVLTQERAQRPGRYLDTGEKKWKTNFYKTIPSPLVPERDIRTK